MKTTSLVSSFDQQKSRVLQNTTGKEVQSLWLTRNSPRLASGFLKWV